MESLKIPVHSHAPFQHPLTVTPIFVQMFIRCLEGVICIDYNASRRVTFGILENATALLLKQIICLELYKSEKMAMRRQQD